MANKPELVVVHVPVIHAGYVELFDRHDKARIGVLDQDVLDGFSYLRKDIRALKPAQSAEILTKCGREVVLLGRAALESINPEEIDIIMPADDVSRTLAESCFNGLVQFEPVFLRWDRENTAVNVEVRPDRIVQYDDQCEPLVTLLRDEAARSSNIWRRVGAALLVEGWVMSSHNQHMPSEYTPWIDGDPRSTLKRGIGIEVTTDRHAEADLIARAAKNGIKLAGASIYVDTFPCPACAKLIASTGIRECYYIESYAMLDGLSVMKDADVEIIRIDGVEQASKNGLEWKPYPEK